MPLYEDDSKPSMPTSNDGGNAWLSSDDELDDDGGSDDSDELDNSDDSDELENSSDDWLEDESDTVASGRAEPLLIAYHSVPAGDELPVMRSARIEYSPSALSSTVCLMKYIAQ